MKLLAQLLYSANPLSHMRPLMLLSVIFLATSQAIQADNGDDWSDDEWGEESSSDLSINHRIEAGLGSFIHDNNYVEQDLSLAELRYRFELSNYWGGTLASLKADIHISFKACQCSPPVV